MQNAIQWFKDRFSEATTWDGVTVLIISGAALLSSPFIKYLAVAGMVFGVYRIVRTEVAKR